MTKQDENDLAFLLAQELPLLDDEMIRDAIKFMHSAHISRAKLSQMMGVSLIDLDQALKDYQDN